jgi:hypothetical protein
MGFDRDRRATPHGAKFGPPPAVARGRPPSSVACLRVAPLRDCAALLVSGLPRAITILVLIEFRP